MVYRSVLLDSQVVSKAQTVTVGRLKLAKKGYKAVAELNSDMRLNMSLGADQMPVEKDIELMPEVDQSLSLPGEDEWREEEPVSSTRR